MKANILVNFMELEQKLAKLILSDAPAMSDQEVGQANRHLVDLLGVALAGTRQDSFAKLRGTIDPPLSGKLSASVWGSRARLSLRNAGLLNAYAAHVLDYDDDEVEYSMAHITVTAATAALTAADALGSTSLLEVLRAYLVAIEVAMRLGEAANPLHYRSGWHATATLGTFAACAAAGRILGLTEEQMCHALRYCCSFAAGIRGNFGSDAKPYQVGKAVSNAFEAIELAQAGMTSTKGALFGPKGYSSIFSQADRDVETIIESFGRPYRFLGGSMAIKIAPCCTASHTAIFAMKVLKAKFGFKAEAIQQVTCTVDAHVPGLLSFPHPKNASEARFSMQFALAATVVYGRAGLAEFELANLPLPDVVSKLMEKITLAVDTTLPRGPSNASMSAVVEIALADGQLIRHNQDATPGSALEPLSDDALAEKFIECLGVEDRKAGFVLFRSLIGASMEESASIYLNKLVA
ncbi:MmgE/PrpD family protein [Neorhizobium galegae]|uniref:MmgE/PrpD family protein n=1 Tax=Neorhizobium galegae TaxID=399 RepID=UPI0006216E38|nr:MmgE/PrpD family protein [Neorhizobium galegae]CDZ55178.1 MmgE/PrpD family protein [Neorhizobium galegae bv. orientalis]